MLTDGREKRYSRTPPQITVMQASIISIVWLSYGYRMADDMLRGAALEGVDADGWHAAVAALVKADRKIDPDRGKDPGQPAGYGGVGGRQGTVHASTMA